MSRFPLHLEKRKSQRYPMLEPRDEGELRFGDVRLPVRILDESAEGFAVSAEGPLDLIPNMDGLLRAGEDWYEVRVAQLVPVTVSEVPPSPERHALPAGSAVPSVASRRGPLFRIGLRRLRDVGNPDMKSWKLLWLIMGLRLRQHCPGKGLGKFLGLFFLVLIAGAAVLSLLIWGSRRAAVQNAWENVQKRTFQPLRDKEQGIVQGEGDAALPGSPWNSHYRKQKKFQEVLRHARGAAVFLELEVAGELQLTDSQKEAIRAIAEETRKKIDDLRNIPASSDSPNHDDQVKRRLFSEGRKKAFQVLTERQRKRWEALAGKDL
ncbi:MAG: hypothetical protein JXB10_06225 [Pirellulales bacterium]|nr:hypothetical protein [Pirellulales bacterium]